MSKLREYWFSDVDNVFSIGLLLMFLCFFVECTSDAVTDDLLRLRECTEAPP